MRKLLFAFTAVIISLQAQAQYRQLPLGSIKAEGWLLEQLQRQATGLTGHLDEVYPEVMGPSNAWLGGDGDAWERGPYWIDGLLPLAYILDDASLKEKALKWVEAILQSQQENGYFGPSEDHPFVYGLQRGKTHDWWPRMVALKIVQQYYSATGDARVIDFLTKYFRYQLETLPELPLNHWSEWAQERGADNLEVVMWLHGITHEEWLLELADLIHSQSTDWASMFREGVIFTRQGSVHTVNLAQGFKAPVVWWLYSNWEGDVLAPRRAMELIRNTFGFPTGLWAGDEQVQFGDPARGSELCAAVEMMFSLEEMLRLSGENIWADQLERIAYNALPTQITDDFSAKQYYQQVNQVA
ncbi:MAG: glycoside hydrolase family 127 protein, partial [Bacteroidales bacterium]|nr:glycoside hydrolase family 127 protein [Bacteroidales bacterium]